MYDVRLMGSGDWRVLDALGIKHNHFPEISVHVHDAARYKNLNFIPQSRKMLQSLRHPDYQLKFLAILADYGESDLKRRFTRRTFISVLGLLLESPAYTNITMIDETYNELQKQEQRPDNQQISFAYIKSFIKRTSPAVYEEMYGEKIRATRTHR